MSDSRTFTQRSLAEFIDRDRDEHLLALVVVWAIDEPERLAEVILIPNDRESVLGRGGPRDGDRATRLGFCRQRPQQTTDTGYVASRHISREQQLIGSQASTGTVHNIGRCPLIINGVAAKEATVRRGDILELKNVMSFLCVERPTKMHFDNKGSQSPGHAFGEADEHGMVGESQAAWKLRSEIAFAAKQPVHLMVRGESGTGKELVARAVHALSSRASRPIVARNAATFPEGLVDAELFGNIRNYPNPQMPGRPGLIGEADGSTLYLDEVGELPEKLQAHLLRVLDSGEYQRLGDSATHRSDFRLIAATNRPDDHLKHDLRARLPLNIEVPPLQTRREDVVLLVRHLLRRIARDQASFAEQYFNDGDYRQEPRIDPAFVRLLLQHEYGTHVRELQRILWQSVAMSRGNFLRWEGNNLNAPSPAQSFVDPYAIPPELIQECLDRLGSQKEVVAELGLPNRHILARLIKKYGLQVRGK